MAQEKKATETIVKTEYKQEVDEFLNFISELNQNERNEFIVFMQATRFAKNLYRR